MPWRLKHSNLPIFVSFTDISKLQEIENYTALQINSKEVYEAFSTCFAELDWGKDLGVYTPFRRTLVDLQGCIN